MGRPLNKKYFGNRNVGSPTTTTDDGIGGKSVASIAVTAVGTYTTRPTITLTGNTSLPNGVVATATITSEAKTGAVTTAGTGYKVGDVLTLTSAGGSAIAYVATITGANPTGPIATVNFTGTGASRGSFEALPGAKIAAEGGSGTGAEITITFQSKTTATIVPGSGYTTAPTAAVSGGGVTLGPVVMTTPVANTAPAGSGFNPDAGIIAYAYTGSSAKQADITKQVSTDRYKVNTSDTNGTAITAQLKTTGASSVVGEMTITATDSAGKTYYVKKLMSRKVVIVPYGTAGHEFPLNADTTPQRVQWTFDAPTENVSVQIENG